MRPPSCFLDSSAHKLIRYTHVKHMFGFVSHSCDKENYSLYGDKQLPEKDYIISRKRILDDLEEIDEKLEQFCGQSDGVSVATDEFISKASYFLMIEKMLSDSFSDFNEYIRNIDLNIPKNFVKSIIGSIIVEDGRVKSIVFKNGIKHDFFYK